jgi:CRP/FNR family cyclic AMP-dependent transcriptional regulator
MSSSEKSDGAISSELQENMNLLRQLDFFSSLRLEALKVIAYLCSRESFEPEDELISQDEDSGRAFYLLSGKVTLEHTDDQGTTMYREFGPESFLGGLNLLAEMHSLFTVRAAVNTTCLVLTREKFGRVVEQFPDLMPKILKAMVSGVRNWEKEFINSEGGKMRLGVSMI